MIKIVRTVGDKKLSGESRISDLFARLILQVDRYLLCVEFHFEHSL